MHVLKRHWIILVWFIVGFFVFPLTPPISQHFLYEQSVLGQYNDAHTVMHLEPSLSKKSMQLHKSLLPTNESSPYESFYFYLLLLVLFLFFVHSRIRELLKRHLLAILKFSSITYPHSFKFRA